jgi:hypothetical protein
MTRGALSLVSVCFGACLLVAAGCGSSPGTGGSPPGTGGSGVAGNNGTAGSSGTAGTGTGGNSPGTGGATTGTGGAGGRDAGGSAGTGVGGSSATGGMSGGSVGGAGGMAISSSTEDTGADCPKLPAPPAFSALPSIANLPDPFMRVDGTRITSKADWRCRRAEIGSQIQFWGTGPKGAPPSNLTATYAGGNLTVTITQSGATITLTSKITTPSGTGPFPLIIGMNTPTGSLPANLFAGVATMTFTGSQLVPDSLNVTRGAGTYFTMYPDKNTGAMIEWAWGVSRLIDGLYKTASQNKIDLTRIALTIPEESGGGGEASWRFMATQTGTEDLEAAQGTAWYASNLLRFNNATAPKLPYDMHELVAMIAPRAILAIENTGIDRLGSQAGGVSMRAATEIYKALGIPDRIGFSQAQAAAHCSFPSIQSPDVQAFVDKFLLGKQNANTTVARDSYRTDLTKWVTWSTPQLQ